MTESDCIQKLENFEKRLKDVETPTGHIGICLELVAMIKDFTEAQSSDDDGYRGNDLYQNPFYAYFNDSSRDMHTQFPIRKLALLSAIDGYKRHLEGKVSAGGRSDG